MADNGRPNPTVMREIEKSVLLQSIDNLWREHLVTLDHLSKVVGWRGLAQRDPLNEYKQEAYELFQKLLADLREMVIGQLSHVEIQFQPPRAAAARPRRLSEIHIDPDLGENDAVTQSPGHHRRRASRRPARWRASAATSPKPTRGSARSTRSCWSACRATPPAPAARARSSSTATAASRGGASRFAIYPRLLAA